MWETVVKTQSVGFFTSVDEGEECRDNGHNRSTETTALTRPA